MTTTEAKQGAATRPRRLLGVDAARGMALIGMMAIHITPSVNDSGERSTAYLIASGRSAALFAMLAGVGLALAYGGRKPLRGRMFGGAAAAIAVRALALIVVGLILGGLDSGVAVILVYYGFLFVIAIPFLRFGPGVLLPLAAVWAIVTPIVSHYWRETLSLSTYANISPESFADPAGMFRDLFLTGYYPVLPWMAYLLAGLGVGRLSLPSGRTAGWLLAGGATLAAATWAVSWWLINSAGGLDNLVSAGVGNHPVSRHPFTDGVLTTSFFGTTPATSPWWLTVASPHTATPFDLLHTIGTAIAVVGLMLLIARKLPGLVWPLAAIGSMTFTLYTLHVLVLTSAVPSEADNAFLIHVLFAFAIAMPWRAFVGRGPLESVTAELSGSARRAVDPAP